MFCLAKKAPRPFNGTVCPFCKKAEHANIQIFGNLAYRGDCPSETAEQITAFNLLREDERFGALVFHAKNESKRTHGQAAWDKHKGLVKGVPDIIIPAAPAFICELKREDPTQSKVSIEQINYMLQAQKMGAFVCVAYGHKAVIEAFNHYCELYYSKM